MTLTAPSGRERAQKAVTRRLFCCCSARRTPMRTVVLPPRRGPQRFFGPGLEAEPPSRRPCRSCPYLLALPHPRHLLHHAGKFVEGCATTASAMARCPRSISEMRAGWTPASLPSSQSASRARTLASFKSSPSTLPPCWKFAEAAKRENPTNCFSSGEEFANS